MSAAEAERMENQPRRQRRVQNKGQPRGPRDPRGKRTRTRRFAERGGRLQKNAETAGQAARPETQRQEKEDSRVC